ncbi:hypothetical protein [Pseudescherichia vulneris]|uniref:hypothetical protein n=1 Tax=Pseudescherichia vulneris TaxID=566 RepID=UPI001EE03CF5
MRKAINAFNYLFLFSTIFSLPSVAIAGQATQPVEAPSSNTLTKSDFSVIINNHSVTLDDRWDNNLARDTGIEDAGNFVGEVPFDGTNYKFYQHKKPGVELYSANLWWDKAERSVDDYIVAQITVTTSDIATPRGIHVGASVDDLRKSYGMGQTQHDDGEEWISYAVGAKVLSFQIKNNKVLKITMNYDNDSE